MDPIRDPEGIEIKYLNRTGALNGRKVLEVGCGDGRLMRRYAEYVGSVVGIDPDFKSMIEATETRPVNVATKAGFTHGEAENLPFAADAFETVILAYSL